MNTKRICLWSSPRNLSTALMYSFAQRPDTRVFDEPLYAHYLKTTGADHPGKEEILQEQENDGNTVVRELILSPAEKPVMFFKQMTHHLVQLTKDFLKETINIIYIRNPSQIISSYSVVRPDVTQADIGIQMQWELYQYLAEKDKPAIVLDSGELLKHPEKVLTGLCEAIGIPFYHEMLSWTAGAKPEDGIWAKYWYSNVHKSTGFAKQETSNRELPQHLQALYAESKQYYDLLYQHSIKA